jgi:hypothetical protein
MGYRSAHKEEKKKKKAEKAAAAKANKKAAADAEKDAAKAKKKADATENLAARLAEEAKHPQTYPITKVDPLTTVSRTIKCMTALRDFPSPVRLLLYNFLLVMVQLGLMVS